MTERTVLASGTPFITKLPQPLNDCLLLIMTPNVLNVLSMIGVENILSLIVTVCISIIEDKSRVFSEFEMMFFIAITSRSRIQTLRWMPEDWLTSLATQQAVHEIKHVTVTNDSFGVDTLMRLEPFLEIAHRSIDVFRVLNGELVTLFTSVGKSEVKHQMPVNYSFFLHRVFTVFRYGTNKR